VNTRTAYRLGAALLAVGLSNSVEAADIAIKMPVKAPASVPSYDWNGLYFGGHVGYSRGSAQVDLGEPDPTSFRKSFGSLTGGIQAGYNRVLPSRLLLGVEADLSVLNALSADELAWFRTTADTDLAEKIELMGTLRGRVGYAFDHWMIYATGGFAWSLGRFIQTPGVVDETDRVLHLHTGWSAGAGTEVALAPSWTLRLEYLYRNFGQADVAFPSGATAASSSFPRISLIMPTPAISSLRFRRRWTTGTATSRRCGCWPPTFSTGPSRSSVFTSAMPPRPCPAHINGRTDRPM